MSLVPILVALGLILCVAIPAGMQLFRAARERRSVRQELKGWESTMANAQAPATSDTSSTWAPLAIRRKSTDIVTRAIRTVFLNRNAEPDLEALATVLSQGEASKLAFARAAPNMMFLCGLGGTAFGIMLSIYGLSTVQHARLSQEEFAQNLNQALASIPGAFVATMLGILSALICAIFVNNAAKDQSDLLARVQEFILDQVAPVVIPPRSDQVLWDLKTAVERLGQGLVTVPQQLAEIYQELTESLKLTSSEIIQTSSQIVKSLEAAKQIATKTSKSADQVALASSALNESTAALKQTHEQLGTLHERMLREFAETRQVIDGGVERAISSLDRATHDHLEGMAGGAKSFIDSSDKTAERLAGAAQVIAQVGGNIEALNDLVKQQAEEVWQRVGTRIENSMSRAEDVFKNYKERVEDIETRLTQGLNRLHEDFSNLLSRLDPRLLPEEEWKNVRNALTATGPALQELTSRLRELQSAHESLNRLSDAIERLEGKLVTPSSATPPGPSSPGQILRTERIEDLLKRISDQLEGLNRQLATGKLGRGDSHSGPHPGPDHRTQQPGGRRHAGWFRWLSAPFSLISRLGGGRRKP